MIIPPTPTATYTHRLNNNDTYFGDFEGHTQTPLPCLRLVFSRSFFFFIIIIFFFFIFFSRVLDTSIGAGERQQIKCVAKTSTVTSAIPEHILYTGGERELGVGRFWGWEEGWWVGVGTKLGRAGHGRWAGHAEAAHRTSWRALWTLRFSSELLPPFSTSAAAAAAVLPPPPP